MKAHTIFFLSPANLSGERAALVIGDRETLPLAAALRAPEGAPLGEVFTFVSGLYFRGKRTYAETFGRPPPGLDGGGGLVISPGEGLRFLHEPVTLARLRAWAAIDVDAGNAAFVRPLADHAAALYRTHGADTRFVLLGSVASDKYVGPLGEIFGDDLLFPQAFVGRGDMSRGALLLRAARDGRELDYVPVLGSPRNGRRAPPLSPRRAARPAGTAPGAAPPEVVVLVGLPGAGKSTFRAQRFGATHRPVSRDLERAGRRPARSPVELVAAALASGASVVVDNTNVSRADRAALVAAARQRGASITCYFFDCDPATCVAHNANRRAGARVPAVAIFAAAKRLEPPRADEGFDALYVVTPLPDGAFAITEGEPR